MISDDENEYYYDENDYPKNDDDVNETYDDEDENLKYDNENEKYDNENEKYDNENEKYDYEDENEKYDEDESKKESIQTSPKEFKSIRKIINPSELTPFDFGKEFTRDDITKLYIFNNPIKEEFNFIPTITTTPKNKFIIEKKDYNSLICDMELFEWTDFDIDIFNDHKSFIASTQVFPLFSIYLGKIFGNDLSVFTMNMISNSKYLEYNSWLIKDVYNNETAKRSIDRIFNFPMMIKIDSNDMKNYIKREKLSYDWYYFPILIKEEQVGTNYYYKCNY